VPDDRKIPPQDASSRALLGWLWRSYMRQHFWTIAAAVFFMSLEGSMLGALSWLIQPMFDDIFVAGNSGAIWTLGIAIIGIFVLRAIAAMGQKVYMTKANELAAADIRLDLLRHLMVLDTRYHQNNPPGNLIERVNGDVGAVGTVWANILASFARDGIALLWLFGAALYIDWRWTAIALVGIPLLVLPSLSVQGFIRRRAKTAREIAARLSIRLDEVFHGVSAIKLNSLESYQAGRYRNLINDKVRAEVRKAFGEATIPGLIDLMSGIGFFCVIAYGGSQIIAGNKTIGEFMAFFTAMALAFEPLRRLGTLSGQMQTAAASIDRIGTILGEEPRITSPAAPLAAPKGAPEIRLEAVELAYDDLPVLRGASFTAEAGKTTALVGASGAGKSTVFNTLTRLVDPQSGAVTIDGTPVAAMSLADLRGLISVVAQDAALFDETLRDNILLGREGVSPEHLDKVLTAAHVSDFLDRLPEGLDSPAGPRGSNLSGGQRQRVAIARALLRDTPILLLDEATSALDTKSEAIVQEALDRLSEGRTTLVLAHRLSTVRNADKIVVMDQGQVVDQGTHDELLKRGGLYAELYRLQFQSEESGK
jgi:subfamily B ATP-binding cassette protein MsbA